MASSFEVNIVSAQEQIFQGEVEMVFAPASQGEIGIAPGHAPLITSLVPGEVLVSLAGGEKKGFYVSGGLLEIQPKMVTVLSDTAERSDDLDEAAILKAKEEAEQAFHDRDGKVDYEIVQQQLLEASARYQALQRMKGRR